MSANGDQLASLLNPIMGTTPAIRRTCALICRACPAYARIQVGWCNEEMGESQTKRIEKEEARLEELIRRLVHQLPQGDVNGESRTISVSFGGDPRGYSVKLWALPQGAEPESGARSAVWNTWGGAESGLGVPGS